MPLHRQIVIIEDDELDAENIVSAINDFHIKNEIKAFVDPDEAFDYLVGCTGKPLIIISDVKMGKLDGLSLRRKILAEPSLVEKAIPFIFFSAMASPSVIRDAYKLDIQGFFAKPGTYHEFKVFLLVILAYWQRAQHPTAPPIPTDAVPPLQSGIPLL